MSRLAFAVAAFSFLVAQAFGQNWTPQGSITSRQYENQIRENGQVVATEFFTLEYSVETWIEDTGQKQGPHMTCDNKCRGGVHEEHAKCNFSCDVRCVERHRVTVRGEYRPDRAAMNAATQAANGLAVQGGGTYSPSDWSHRVSSALAAFRKDARKSKTFSMDHAGACSGLDQWVGTKTYNFHVKGTLKKSGYRMSRGVRAPINETVGSHESVVASADIVQDDVLEQRDWTHCMCKLVLNTEEFIDAWEAIDNYFNEMFQKITEQVEAATVGASAVIMRNKAGERVDPGESKVTVLPKDMNACAVQIENGTGQDVEVTIPVGTVFEAQNKSDQSMSTSVRASGMLYAGETKTFFVSLRPQQRQTTAEFPFRWFCTEMNKKAPTVASKYVMRPPQDDVLVRLGAITNNSRVRGPHDQARVWIYTDHAPIDKINDKLFPTVSEGRYATLLWQVGTVGGVDIGSKEYVACLEPKLLESVPLDDKATAWLASMLTEFKAREFARYMEREAASVSRTMESDPEYGPGHVATLATAMLSEDNAEVRTAGLKFLTALPPRLREALVKAGGLEAVRNCLSSGNASEAGLAVDVLIAYDDKGLLGASWEQLPSDALKQRAKKHLGIE